MKLLKVLGLVLGAAVALAPAALAGVPVTARESVTVTDAMVRLGDLFQNVAGRESEPVGPAPAPGERTTFDADRLAAIAAANGIEWQPRSRGERVQVERGSKLVDGPEIQRQLAQAVAKRTPGRDVEVELEGRPQPIHLPVGSPSSIRFEDFNLAAERVTATVIAPTGDGRENRIAVAGKIFPVLDVPVLGRPVMPGEQVGQDDVEWIKVRASKLRQGVATDPKQVLGRTPRRPLSPGLPLSLRDLQDRVVVSKGSLVTVVLQMPQMTLTTRGKALEDGADGAAIRVLSSSGDRTIEATVLGPDLVEVKPVQSIAAMLGRKK